MTDNPIVVFFAMLLGAFLLLALFIAVTAPSFKNAQDASIAECRARGGHALVTPGSNYAQCLLD